MNAQQRVALKAHKKFKVWFEIERDARRMTDAQETAGHRMLCCLYFRAKNDIAPPTAGKDAAEFMRVFCVANSHQN